MINYLFVTMADCSPFISLNPFYKMLLDIINLFSGNLKLKSNLHDLSQLTHMVIIFVPFEPVFKELWSKINESKTPRFSHEK